MTQQELLDQANEIIAKWQPILRLGNWRIRAEVVEQEDINGNVAQVDWNIALQYAIIRVADPKRLDIDPLTKDIFELEKTIIHEHELAHVLLSPLWTVYQDLVKELSPSAQRMAANRWDLANEQAVEQLARTLFSMKGGDKDQKV